MCEFRKVTNIKVQNKKRDRFSIFLNEEFAFGIHQDVLLKSGIAKGDELSQDQIHEILTLEEKKKAQDKAIRLLAVRARSKKEISDRLKQSHFSNATVSSILDDLEEKKFINDSEFAILFARNRVQTKPTGKFLLRRELNQKGLSESDIEKGIMAAYSEAKEHDLAFKAASKKKKALKQDDNIVKKKVTDYLKRRGFSWDIIIDVIEHWEEI